MSNRDAKSSDEIENVKYRRSTNPKKEGGHRPFYRGRKDLGKVKPGSASWKGLIEDQNVKSTRFRARETNGGGQQRRESGKKTLVRKVIEMTFVRTIPGKKSAMR